MAVNQYACCLFYVLFLFRLILDKEIRLHCIGFSLYIRSTQTHKAMKTFTFYKENKLSKEYTLTVDELKEKFIAFLKTKEKNWIDYYVFNLVQIFITDPAGLDSAFDADDLAIIKDELNDTQWNYLKSIGIK